ncbi:hypothetical protein [Kurlavirus BKC-1]|nr:hypothetical protein [Kurlavirus BKC-1]
MEAFLSNKEILPFMLTTDIEFREERTNTESPCGFQLFRSKPPVKTIFLMRCKSTFSFRKGTNIKHGLFSSVIEHGKERENGPRTYKKLIRVRGRYVNGKLEGEKEKVFYSLKKGQYVLCKTRTVMCRGGIKHGVQTTKRPGREVIIKMYQDGERIDDVEQWRVA